MIINAPVLTVRVRDHLHEAIPIMDGMSVVQININKVHLAKISVLECVSNTYCISTEDEVILQGLSKDLCGVYGEVKISIDNYELEVI